MQDLIKIDQDGKITARELYEFLNLAPSQFSRWAKTNIEENDFYQEGVDWQGFDIMSSGNMAKDYHLTIDFAKHLCMLSRSERGKQARSYFVEAENRLKAVTTPTCIEDTLIATLTAMKDLRLQGEKHQAQLNQQGEAIRLLAAKIETSPTDYFTIAGYASLRGIKVDNVKAAILGKQATKLSNDADYPIGKIKDMRYGHVNTYHIDILNVVFAGA